MDLCTLCPCKPDGSSETFVIMEVADDNEAYIRAIHVLDQHPSAAHVVIWAGERRVAIRHRVHDALQAVLRQQR